MRDLLLVGFLFFASFYAIKRPYLGVAAWIWISLTAPANWAFGFSQDFRLNLTIVLVTALGYLFSKRAESTRLTSLGALVLIFGFWTLITTAANSSMDPDWVWATWIEFIKVVALFVFVYLTVSKRAHIETLVWAIVLAISAYAGMEAVKFVLSGGAHRIVGRAGVIIDRNDLAVAINMCIPLLIYLIETVKHKKLKLGLMVLLGLNLLSIIGTYSRGGFIGLAIVGLFFWARSRYKFAWALAAVLSLPLLYQFAPDDWKERQSTVATAAEEDLSFIGRLWAWKVSALIALDHPITGGGFRAVMDPGLWARYAADTPDFTPIETPPIPLYVPPKAAHNIYLQVLGDHGFVGLFIFLGILLNSLVVTRSNFRRGKQQEVGWYAKLSSAIGLSMIGYCITGGNVSLAYFDLLYAILGIVVVMYSRREALLAESTPGRSTG